MLKTTLVVCVLVGAVATAQESKPQKPQNPESIAGTWVILLEGHQVGLGLEQNGTTVTGTLVIMGKNVPVDGEFIHPRLTLAGDAQVGLHGDQQTAPMKITGTLKEDGTLEGLMDTARGPMKWTAERLKPPKQMRAPDGGATYGPAPGVCAGR